MKSMILIVEDEKELALAISEKLQNDGYETEHVATGEEAIAHFERGSYWLVVLDYMLPGMDGLATLEKIKERWPGTAVIFVTAYGDNELAWKCLHLGANEYLNKPFNLRNLSFFVYKLMMENVDENEINLFKKENRASAANIIYKSPEMKNIVARIDTVVRSSKTVLITGESGTGKEIIATAIHHNTYNPRKDKPYFVVNCSAIPEPLIESELFGHVRGAFSGALLEKTGLIEMADGGTIYLDEISSSSLSFQKKLMRVIETGEFYRVGAPLERKTDVFIIAATNTELESDVENDRFNKDLYKKLKAVHIEIPPLRERHDDIEPLVLFFIRMFNSETGKGLRLTPDAMKALCQYPWPGNVRELKNTIYSFGMQSEKSTISSDDLPDRIKAMSAMGFKGTFLDLKAEVIQEFERKYFVTLLRDAKGNVSRVARVAQIARVNLIQKLKNLGIDPKKFK